jgi:hypothetical protein
MKTIVILAALLLFAGCGRTPPSDAELAQRFKTLEPTLDAVVRLASAEPESFGLIAGSVNPPGAISEVKAKELTRLLREARVLRFGKLKDGSMSFEVFSHSILLDSWHKGFIHSTNQFRTADGPLNEGHGGSPGRKKIEDNWYIYYHISS